MLAPNKPISDCNVSTAAVVAVTVPASAMQAWQALTDPAIVSCWFGTLTPALRVGERACLDFGDGDFFLLEALRIEPPRLLQYRWRFLGIGPLDTVTWRISPEDSGCEVTVTDDEMQRSPQWNEELKEGWSDFTQRLKKFLTTAQHTRYDWRREFDGCIELSGTMESVWEALFAAKAQAQWLPFSGSTLQEGACLISDSKEPHRFQIKDIQWEPPNFVQFQLATSQWLQPTSCRLEINPSRDGARLTVRHTGWEAISLRNDYQRQQRKRFCGQWIRALQHARQLTKHPT